MRRRPPRPSGHGSQVKGPGPSRREPRRRGTPARRAGRVEPAGASPGAMVWQDRPPLHPARPGGLEAQAKGGYESLSPRKQWSVGPPFASCLGACSRASSVVSRGQTRPIGAISDAANSTVVLGTIRPRQQIGATRAVPSQTRVGGRSATPEPACRRQGGLRHPLGARRTSGCLPFAVWAERSGISSANGLDWCRTDSESESLAIERRKTFRGSLCCSHTRGHAAAPYRSGASSPAGVD